jgi:hypothetical protein
LRPSVLQPVYKRLLPDDIVRLSAGDELIIVIPNSMPGRADAAKAADIAGVCEFYRKAFFAVGRETAGRHLARQDVEDQHRLRREDRWFHEYPVRVRAYAEREHFSREYVEERSVMFSWGQGAGLSLEVCGYSVARTVLLQFRHVAYLEIYGRAAPDAFLNNAIEFNDTRNVDSLSAPFVEQLSLVNGCRFGTVEVLWKYYRALNSSHRRTAARVAARAARAANAISPDESISKWDDFMPDDPEYCLSLIRLELDDENIDRFVLFVDNLYKESFVAVYTEFVIPDGFLLDRRSIAEMYRLMQRLFPFVHSVLALTVSPKRRRDAGDWVYLSPFLTNGREGKGISQLDDDPVDGDPVGNDPVNDDTNDDDPVDDDGCPGDDGLTRRERAVLEFFIAKIRVRSQKKMKHWAMIASLGNHSRGQSGIPNHPLHGSGSSMTTVWGTLNHIFETSTAARRDLVAKQYTVSMAFDNWQINVNKMWQSYGCSSKFMRGVATFIKRDKAILLPVGSIMVSPSGVKFKITSSTYLDAYSIVIRGSILESDDRATIGHPTEFAGGNNGSLDAPCPRNADEHRITSGNLIWPAIGWDILLLKGVAPCASPLSYIDPVVPPPLNACVLSSVSSDDLLLRQRTFFMSGTENTRQITSTEYYNLSMDVEDLCILDSFACFLSRMTKDNDNGIGVDEDENEHGLHRPCIHDGLPHDYESERVFLEHLQACRPGIHKAMCFRNELLDHMYPYGRDPDTYIHEPLIGREETSNEGMMLTNASLLEILGLLTKRDGGLFDLGPNATKRCVFLYGDALSISLHSSLHDKILRQITRLGNENYVKILLAAQSRLFVQKGAFHQLMHQLAAIYKQYYGGFMQPFQADNQVKRVNGDPIKGGYQSHEQFARKLYNACNRFLLRSYCKSGFFKSGFEMPAVFESDDDRIRWILDDYRRFRRSWEISRHEPSRVIALYLKSMRSYLRCKNAISNRDAWLLEIESCNLLPIWKMMGKNIYMRLQCEYMETFYDDKKVPGVYREIMRANSFCTKPSGATVAFDEENEHYNRMLKQMPVAPTLEGAVMRSRHVVLANKAAKEMWGLPKSRWKRGTSLTDDIFDIEGMLATCGVFSSYNAVKMDKDYFWNCVRRKVSGVGSPRERERTTLPLSQHECVMSHRLLGGDNDVAESGAESDINNEDGDIDDNRSTCSLGTMDGSVSAPIHTDEGVDSNNADEGELLQLMTDEERADYLSQNMRKLGNTAKRPMHAHLTSDIFEHGRLLIGRTQARIRKDALNKQQRQRDLIEQSVTYFKTLVSERMDILERSSTRSSNKETVYNLPSWKRKFKQYLENNT